MIRAVVNTLQSRRTLIFGCAIAAIGYIFSIATSSIGTVLLLTVWLFNSKKYKFKILLNKRPLLLLILFFLIYSLGIFYSSNLGQATKDITRMLPFLVFPLIFSTIKPLDKIEQFLILRIFLISVVIFYIICFANAIARQLHFYDQGGNFNWYFFFRYDFLQIFQQHPTYVAMFTLLSISLTLFRSKELIQNRTTLLIVRLILLIGLLLTGSRIGYIIMIIILFHYSLRTIYLKGRGKRAMAIIKSLALFIVLVIMGWNIPIVKERIQFTIGLKQDYRFNDKNSIQDGSPEKQGRLLLWQDALELIREKPLLGFGTGSNKSILAKKYREKSHYLFLQKKYNVHNTYLELMLSGGVLILSMYFLILITLFFQSVWRRDHLILSFLLIIAITAITETIFRSQGVVFFSFFYCFFLSNNYKNGIVLIGPYPPPVGGISLFVKNLEEFIRTKYKDRLTIINEFGNNKDNLTYHLSSTSKIVYFQRLAKFILMNNFYSCIYYNGVHGYTRFFLVLVGKILGFKVVLHFHGKSVIKFYKEGFLNKKISDFTLNNAELLIAVSNNIIDELKRYNPRHKILNIPAYIPSKKVEKSKNVSLFIKNLNPIKKYYLSYGTLDKTINGRYNYGILELIKFFGSEKIKTNQIHLIFVMILYKAEQISEYHENLEQLFKKHSESISVFINYGNDPLIPFFNHARGYIRWTFEDGLGVSLLEALDYGIMAIASNVCDRPKDVLTFDPTNPKELESLIFRKDKNVIETQSKNYENSYVSIFRELGLSLSDSH